MSHVSAAQPIFNFWEFVHCARCHLPFSLDLGGQPQVPFWLTECGHVVCNNHLNADQSCAQCGETGVQVVPLQRDMEQPMSDWFRPASEALDSVAHAAKFQLETVASLARYHRTKCIQQRALIDRMKSEIMEIKALRKAVEELKQENEHLRSYIRYSEEPSQEQNVNGKRRMVDSYRYPDNPRSNSSPRSIVTPLGPDRLTLPPSHHQPNFSAGRASETRSNPIASHGLSNVQPQTSRLGDRPGSSRFIQQYAYVPNDGPMQPPVLSHSQAGPVRQAQARVLQTHHDPPQRSDGPWRSVPSSHPPTQPQRFGAAIQSSTRDRLQMPPPPAPQEQANYSHPGRTHSTAALHQSSSSSSRPFVPPTPNRTVSMTPNTNRRFVPSTPSGRPGPSNPSGFSAPHQGISRAPSRAAGPLPAQGTNQRIPFVPGGNQQDLR